MQLPAARSCLTHSEVRLSQRLAEEQRVTRRVDTGHLSSYPRIQSLARCPGISLPMASGSADLAAQDELSPCKRYLIQRESANLSGFV